MLSAEPLQLNNHPHSSPLKKIRLNLVDIEQEESLVLSKMPAPSLLQRTVTRTPCKHGVWDAFPMMDTMQEGSEGVHNVVGFCRLQSRIGSRGIEK